MRIALWLTAVLFALASLAIILMLIRGKDLPSVAPKLTMSDILNIALLVVAVVSLYIAVAAYTDAKTSGGKQQESLDASRHSLETAVQIAVGQQDLLKENLGLLKQNLETSETQLRILQADQQRTLAELSKKPKIVMWGAYVPLEPSNVPGEIWLIEKHPTESQVVGVIRLRNNGDGALTKAFLHVTIKDPLFTTAKLGCNNFPFKIPPEPPKIRGALTMILISVGDLLPGAPPTDVDVAIDYTKGSSDFKLDFAIYGDQIPTEVSLGTVRLRAR